MKNNSSRSLNSGLLLSVLLLMGSTKLSCAEGLVPDYVPYNGRTGFLEIPISNSTWYIGFFGTPGNSVDAVAAGWRVRAAQLCALGAKPKFVELHYLGEPILNQDKVVSRNDDLQGWMLPIVHSAPVFVPIYTAGSHSEPYMPTKMAAARCLTVQEEPNDKGRLQDGTEAINAAKNLGISVR